MADEEVIQSVLSKNPEITRTQILQALETEKRKTGGLIEDETLLRLIAARHGVEVPQKKTYNCCLSISLLVPRLNDVTVSGRIVAIFPVKSFEGKQSGKYASLLIVDRAGLLRVMLWNDKTSLIESGELMAGQIASFSHAYTREDRNGQTELHLGAKSKVEVNPQDVDEAGFPFISRFSTKCGDITKTQLQVQLAGKVKEIFPSSTFTRQDQTNGKVLRFVLADDSGEVTVVAWNEKVDELEPLLRNGVEVRLLNAKAKTTSNGGFEVHVDAATYVDFSASRGP
ncbi:MAG TPA: OB-fold nucleic acid binding domain-containing protein [Candidatus Bathyarchaeia archaeon]|nr:OB-fold nucleic acid binding domain-containing protein [Candidatus Bathyarchaeia archaeon]